MVAAHTEGLTGHTQVVYIPSGTYEIRKTIRMNTDTILMGDPTNVCAGLCCLPSSLPRLTDLSYVSRPF